MASSDEIDAFVSAAAALLDLQLSETSHRAVAANIAILLDRASDFEGIKMADDLDPATLLRP
ncbi:AtzG-like protein [Phenylobacterium aquaticum]|uniref:AtzG-like protein n=1 Tax=Phenylobacterium aquaticum TaxID=1763816 RepID=UPI001F5D7481|nr:AtzG-like protein [Phenylobacterium aquaticum]MCI3135511.1 DUF4089 domain-containing protein [Phenylobacterium aquaticum]